MKDSAILGIDIGGTMVRVGLFNRSGKILSVSESILTPKNGAEAGFIKITELSKSILEKFKQYELLGIGLGVTGPVNREEGTINNPFTLPTWDQVPIVNWFQDWAGKPVFLENDADMAALGEYWQGAGLNAHRLYAVTIGTGIGTAFILEGSIYRGIDGSHPEGGHQIIDPDGPECYCGSKGCWEVLSSGTAIAALAQSMLADNQNSLLNRLSSGNIKVVDARMIASAARMKDPLALEVIQTAANNFSRGLINTLLITAPDILVLSGGVVKSLDLFMPTIRREMKAHSIMVPITKIEIKSSKLGYYAGIFGCAYHVIQNTQP